MTFMIWLDESITKSVIKKYEYDLTNHEVKLTWEFLEYKKKKIMTRTFKIHLDGILRSWGMLICYQSGVSKLSLDFVGLRKIAFYEHYLYTILY